MAAGRLAEGAAAFREVAGPGIDDQTYGRILDAVTGCMLGSVIQPQMYKGADIPGLARLMADRELILDVMRKLSGSLGVCNIQNGVLGLANCYMFLFVDTFTVYTDMHDLREICDTALEDVSFAVEEGDFVGIIGSTGSGKSTLITHFNGILKPTSGQVLLDGKDIWAKGQDIRKVRFSVGLVFQYPEYQLFEETIYKDIAFGPKNMGLSEEEIDRRVRRAAAFTGLPEDYLERSPFELSGGQKRRVAIAGVLAMEPRVLVLDEPAAGLDPEGRDMILSQVKRYHKETGTTVLLVSHSMEDIAKYADKVLVMDQKKIAMYDRVDKVFARADELLALGLSVPQVTKIFLKLRQMGLDLPQDVYTVPWAVKTILEAKARKEAKGEETTC